MGHASFRITASSIMDPARGLAMAGRHTEAVGYISDALVGISLEQCLSILNGQAKLIDGRDGVLMVEEDDPSHREEMRAKFGGRIRIDGEWFEPYAIVTTVGPMDTDIIDSVRRSRSAVWASQETDRKTWWYRNRQDNDLRMKEATRPLHYADDPHNDRIRYVGGDFLWGKVPGMDRMARAVLMKPCDAPPPGIRAQPSLRHAVVFAIEEGMGIDVRGHHLAYPQFERDPDAVIKAKLEPEDRGDPEAIAAIHESHRQQEAERIARYEAIKAKVREEILRRAGPEDGDGWINLYAGERVVRVPRGPFEGWALSRAGAFSLIDWDPISPPNMKLDNDNQWHSDWMLAAGIDPSVWYKFNFGSVRDEELVEAAHNAAAQIQRERLNFTHEVLAGEGAAAGEVWIAKRGREDMPKPGSVVVLPDASPDWLEVVHEAAAVVTERGGAMAHLVSVLREGRGIPVVRMKGATKTLPEGEVVRVNCSDGSVTIGVPPDPGIFAVDQRSDPLPELR